jgi:5-methylcytosine-specific restriction endonuclease McrA
VEVWKAAEPRARELLAVHQDARAPRPKLAAADVLALRVLVLNRFFAPVSVTSARRALRLLYTGVARALDMNGDSFDFWRWRDLPVRDEDPRVQGVNGSLRLPRVMHLLAFDRCPQPIVRLTRKNLLLRDDQQCQYCGRRPGTRELNIDHVLPRSRGGQDTWENLVIACRSCNLGKGRHTPEEAGMRLLRRPQRPRWSTALQISMAGELDAAWRPFLGT